MSEMEEMYECVACEKMFHVDEMVPAYDEEGGQCGRFCEPCEEQAPRLKEAPEEPEDEPREGARRML